MRIVRDYGGRRVRLTEERLIHILEHPEMRGMVPKIEETLRHPLKVIRSKSDQQARLYYRFYFGVAVGDKYLCVVVKSGRLDDFILTAYFTDTVKKGEQLWPEK